MHVTLDQEQWEVGSDRTLGEVLADVSERAHTKARIVTSLVVDQRRITDRDLDATFLAERSSRFIQLTATSQSQEDIVKSAEPSIKRYAENVHAEGVSLAGAFRTGRGAFPPLDAWMGKLADYLELVEGSPKGIQGSGGLASSVQDLLKARTDRDLVLIADLLEYEILPRLKR
jgi:hypothetical protein